MTTPRAARASTSATLRKELARRLALGALLAGYLVAVAYVTLKPNHHGDGWVDGYGYEPNLIPFAKISEMVASGVRYGMPFEYIVVPILGNVVMTAPFGFLLPVLVPRLGTWPRAVGATAAYSALIELSQLVVGLVAFGLLYRTVDVDDVILNTVGGAVGYGLLVLAERGMTHAHGKTRRGRHAR